jgi:prepilin-type N-terminal cleavage/methylation domain-containing protein
MARSGDRAITSGRAITSRRGLTLIELTFAVLIMAIVMGALAAASHAVQLANEYSQGYGTATQHARVAVDRIDRAVAEAYGTVNYPGVWVTQDTQGSWTFPDTVAIWHPSGSPVNTAGPPLVQELMIFCPDPSAPNNLVLLTAPGDTRQVPATDSVALKSMIDSLKTSGTVNKVLLTELVRVSLVSGGSTRGTVGQQAAVRFVVNMTPSATDWANYTAGKVTWSNLPWPLGIDGSNKGMRQVWLRSEIQLTPGVNWIIGNPAGEGAIPFLGSAVFCYSIP